MKNEIRVNTVEAKNRFNELIAEAARSKRPIVVEKRNEPVAVMLDYESYRASERSEKAKSGRDDALLGELEAFHRAMRKKYPRGTGDSVEILREVREERGVR